MVASASIDARARMSNAELLIEFLMLLTAGLAVVAIPCWALAVLRRRKRRLTIGASMAWIGFLALVFAVLVRWDEMPAAAIGIALLCAYATPIVAIASYVPPPVEIAAYGMLSFLIVVLLVVPMVYLAMGVK